jgi:hypothetical protein
MDPGEVVLAYTPKDDVNDKKKYIAPQTVITPIVQALKDIFVRMRNNTVQQISGYYDTIVKRGDDVDVYTNKAAIEILSK